MLIGFLFISIFSYGQKDKYFIEQAGLNFLADSVYHDEYEGEKLFYDRKITGIDISDLTFKLNFCSFWPDYNENLDSLIEEYNQTNDTVYDALEIKKPIKYRRKYRYSNSPSNKLGFKLRDLKIILFNHSSFLRVWHSFKYNGEYYLRIDVFNKRTSSRNFHYFKITEAGKVINHESVFVTS